MKLKQTESRDDEIKTPPRGTVSMINLKTRKRSENQIEENKKIKVDSNTSFTLMSSNTSTPKIEQNNVENMAENNKNSRHDYGTKRSSKRQRC